MAKGIFFLCLLFISLQLTAQKNISLDFSSVKNTKAALSGLNVSGFYHFTEHLSGGIELNRFFGKKIIRKDIEVEHNLEEIELSAWDFDCNFHFNIPLTNHFTTYPILGFSHTSEKEKLLTQRKEHTDHFWSFNSSIGIMHSLGKISPHFEYLLTWGKVNHEFMLLGFSYELGLKHNKHKIKVKK